MREGLGEANARGLTGRVAHKIHRVRRILDVDGGCNFGAYERSKLIPIRANIHRAAMSDQSVDRIRIEGSNFSPCRVRGDVFEPNKRSSSSSKSLAEVRSTRIVSADKAGQWRRGFELSPAAKTNCSFLRAYTRLQLEVAEPATKSASLFRRGKRDSGISLTVGWSLVKKSSIVLSAEIRNS